MPERIQLRRTKGWRKPEGAVVVARPSRWGNPFRDGLWLTWAAVWLGYMGNPAGRREAAVALHRAWMTGQPVAVRRVDVAHGGSLEFGDGSVVTLADHVSSLALGAASLYPPPAVPAERPDVSALAGHDLACWCPLDQPCHADVLLELAAGEGS